MQAHGTRSLIVPANPLAVERRQWIVQRDKLLSMVRQFVEHPGTTCPARLLVLSNVAQPLAQCLVALGTCPAIAIEHATELLEAMFLPAALRGAPAELLELWLE